MKTIFPIFALFFSHFTQAQTNLTLNYNCKEPSAGFANVEVIDNREGQKLLGYIHKGLSNNGKQIVFEGSIADSLALFFKNTNDNSANQKHLVFILNELFMNENTNDIPENGKLKLSARLFLETDTDRYSELLAIDSIYIVKGMDVTRKLLHSVSEQFCKISKVASESQARPNETTFTRSELDDLDSLEISLLPIFTGQKPKAGIFNNYKSFKENDPDIAAEILVERSKKGKLSAYRLHGEKKKRFLMETKGIYAISDGSNIYKATAAGFFEIQNINHKLYYDRPGSFIDANTGSAMWGTYFGMPGSLLVISFSPKKSYRFRFKINHRRGNSIPIAVAEYHGNI